MTKGKRFSVISFGHAKNYFSNPNSSNFGSGFRFVFLSVILFACIVLTGCVSVPPVKSDHGTSRERLSEHIAFLAQPALKGRSPRTRGSRLAREYIEDRFKAYGLIPWQQAKSFELSFGYGRNIVGVLPGSDTNLAREFVLLSAHYDHLGEHGGKIYPGASDNASGVAALLEVARQLSQGPHRPKRSIVFVAFDCEEQMLLGSMAFTCRDDVRKAKIAAVVNMDMLGRNFMDVVSNTLFIAGTEDYPALQQQIRQFGDKDNLRVLPIGEDLTGDRSDHASFESFVSPCLFFSCGIFRDYHEPTDTADKLNYGEIDRSTKVVLQTVRTLADADELKPATNATGDFSELRTVTTVLGEVLEHSQAAGIKTNDVAAFQQLKERVDHILASGKYDHRTRESLILSATGSLGLYFGPLDEREKISDPKQAREEVAALQLMQYTYLNHRDEVMAGYRKLVGELIKYHPGIFHSMPKFHYEIYDISEDNMRLKTNSTGVFQLDALANKMTIDVEINRFIWPFNPSGASINFSVTPLHCAGNDDQLKDYCLLSLRNCRDDKIQTQAYMKLYGVVAGATPTNNFSELLDQRLAAGGFKTETDWLTNCILSGRPDLAKMALNTDGDFQTQSMVNAACMILSDKTCRPDVRVEAIEFLAKQKNQSGLLAMCDVLNDSTAYDQEAYDQLVAGEFFPELPIIKALRPFIEDELKSNKHETIGSTAQEQLKKATGQNYGADAVRWRHWIEKRG